MVGVGVRVTAGERDIRVGRAAAWELPRASRRCSGCAVHLEDDASVVLIRVPDVELRLCVQCARDVSFGLFIVGARVPLNSESEV